MLKAAGRPLLDALWRHAGGHPARHHGLVDRSRSTIFANSMPDIAADPYKIDEISRRLIADTNKWIFSDVLSSYKTLYEQLREQRMSSVRVAMAEVPQGAFCRKE